MLIRTNRVWGIETMMSNWLGMTDVELLLAAESRSEMRRFEGVSIYTLSLCLKHHFAA